jgi:DNA uptake protein ComE-like DNA-binding protein
MQIRGIGRFYAREIVRYRNELGGFSSVEQLLEVRNMRHENFERIAPFVTVDDTKINKIKVNTASVERMRRHPYLNFYQARAVFELRRAAGGLKNISELARLSEFSEIDRQRLEPYLCFE